MHTRRASITGILLLLTTLLLATSANAERKVHVYKAQYRTAAELHPLVETVMGNTGTATIDASTNSILLVGSAEDVRLALDVLKQQDKRLRSIVIHSTTKRLQELDAAGFRVKWNVEAGDFSIGNALPIGGGTNVRVAVGETSQRKDLEFSSTIRVLEGGTGQISTGTTMPVTDHHVGPDHYYESTTMVTAASGLEAKPRILGDGRVQLEINPYQGEFGKGGVIHSSSANTTVIVTPGEIMVIGGIDQEVQSSETSLTSGASRKHTKDEQVLLLDVVIEE